MFKIPNKFIKALLLVAALTIVIGAFEINSLRNEIIELSN